MQREQLARLVALARQDNWTTELWMEMVAQRAEEIKNHLRNMSLSPLGSVHVYHKRLLTEEDKQTFCLSGSGVSLQGDPNFSFETKGIWPKYSYHHPLGLHGAERHVYPVDLMVQMVRWSRERDSRPIRTITRPTKYAELTLKFWGLTVDGTWVGVELDVLDTAIPKEGRTNKREFRIQTSICEAQIRQIELAELPQFGFNFQDVWLRLGKEVNDWKVHQTHLAYQADKLHTCFAEEEQVISIRAEQATHR